MKKTLALLSIVLSVATTGLFAEAVTAPVVSESAPAAAPTKAGKTHHGKHGKHQKQAKKGHKKHAKKHGKKHGEKTAEKSAPDAK